MHDPGACTPGARVVITDSFGDTDSRFFTHSHPLFTCSLSCYLSLSLSLPTLQAAQANSRPVRTADRGCDRGRGNARKRAGECRGGHHRQGAWPEVARKYVRDVTRRAMPGRLTFELKNTTGRGGYNAAIEGRLAWWWHTDNRVYSPN